MTYQHILVAVELTHETKIICQRAQQLAQQNHAKLTVIHVIEEPISIGAGYEFVPVLPEIDTENSLQQEAEHTLKRLLKDYRIDYNEAQVVLTYATKAGIIDSAETLGCDLIVVGSHGRHGLSLLLGSTANAVLHNAPCDILAVRIGQQD